jgi:hypothetical protein
MRQCATMNKKLMKLDERKRNFPSIITVDDALMNIEYKRKRSKIEE